MNCKVGFSFKNSKFARINFRALETIKPTAQFVKS